MFNRLNRLSWLALLPIAFVLPASSSAQEKVLNLYSSRHYETDEALYTNFTKQTGIKVNRIEGGEDPLIERIRNEGDKSPADVLITVDAGRLWRAEQMGLFQPVKSKVLESRIPASYRHPDGLWFGFSTRARIIAYNKAAVKPGEIANYEDLANPKWKGKICTRSAGHVYNLSLMSSLVNYNGEAKTEEWAKAVAGNLARSPKGGDTDQLKAVAAGECDLAISNTYYYFRLLRSDKPDERAVAEKIGVLLPNQGGRGTHVNISGAGVLKNAPHREAAVLFLEYLASDAAQNYFANGNNEWPVVASVKSNNSALGTLGKFKTDALNVGELGKNQPTAQKIADRSGFK
ncbi:MAG TPA: Fe(3+) ABC transporter substrate-binding protein [Burkholderiales bacterium]|nr:Fe(3+) ABC transporter substrate-binding protein [Burkholderiales bacterium]